MHTEIQAFAWTSFWERIKSRRFSNNRWSEETGQVRATEEDLRSWPEEGELKASGVSAKSRNFDAMPEERRSEFVVKDIAEAFREYSDVSNVHRSQARGRKASEIGRYADQLKNPRVNVERIVLVYDGRWIDRALRREIEAYAAVVANVQKRLHGYKAEFSLQFYD